MKKLLLLIFAVLMVQGLLGQSMLQQGDSAFKSKEFFKSIEYYKKALNKETENLVLASITYKIGECYRFANNYVEARTWYEKAMKDGFNESIILNNYAEVLLLAGDYKNAQNYFEQYLKSNPSEKNAQNKLESCKMALKSQSEKPLHVVENEKMLNSKYSDFGPAFVKNRIVFASSRIDKNQKVYEYSGQGYSDFYSAKYDFVKKQWPAPNVCNGGINTKFNDGSIAYNEKTNTAYFMQCNGSKGKDANCNIYYATFNESSDEWSAAKPFEYINPDFSTGHPAINSTGDIMYFVSDMSGGVGGRDIWVIKKGGDGKWGAPSNMGAPINTSGNEMFPYVSGDSVLYYSSDGLVGLGGLDLYITRIKSNTYSKPENLKAPFNSSADDFGFILLGKDSGFFCSNRSGGVGDDDLYSFSLISVIFTATGTIVDKETNKPISKVVVVAKGSDGTIDTSYTDESGVYLFEQLKKDVKYIIAASKKKYLGDSKNITTLGEKFSKDFNKKTGYDLDFSLIRITKEEINIPDIYYDYDKWDLRESSKIELDKMAKVLKENPEVKIIINAHTDARGKPEYNLDLSMKRSQSVVNYLIEKGTAPDRLSAKGWGATKPIVKNAKTEDDHQRNRRTTFSIKNVEDIGNDFKPAEYKKIEAKTVSVNPQVNSEYIQGKGVEFRVQCGASKTVLEDSFFKNLTDKFPNDKIKYTLDPDGFYRYTFGNSPDLDYINELQKKMKDLGQQCFVVAFKDGVKIPLSEAKKYMRRDINK